MDSAELVEHKRAWLEKGSVLKSHLMTWKLKGEGLGYKNTRKGFHERNSHGCVLSQKEELCGWNCQLGPRDACGKAPAVSGEPMTLFFSPSP